MNRRGDHHDNVVAESSFNRENAQRNVFNYIAAFYSSKRKHARNGMLSPVDFKRQQKMKAEGV